MSQLVFSDTTERRNEGKEYISSIIIILNLFVENV